MKTKKSIIRSVGEYLITLEDVMKAAVNSQLAVFRGQRDQSWKLIPGIARPPFNKMAICTDPTSAADQSAERRLMALLRDHGASHFLTWVWQGSPQEVRWKQIIVSQHYRLPTRLLDWTTNPLVALFFATEGVPVTCNIKKCTICNSDKMHDSAVFVVTDIDTFSSFSLAEKNPNPPLYGGPSDPGFLRPPEIDSRIAAQASNFSIRHRPFEPVKANLKLVIPASNRERILKELDSLGVNARTLLPGLEGVANYVNTPPAKAGGFGLRLKAGLIGHSADGCRYTT